jgi:hypothetical protein
VLNSNANVTEANGVISIAGFGTLQSQQLLLRQEDRGISVAKNAVAGVYTITRLHLMTILKRTTLYLVFAQKEYCLIFSDIDVWTFQSKAGSTNIGGAFAAAQIAGFNDQVVKFSGTTTLIATFQPGYEGFQLSQLKFVM